MGEKHVVRFEPVGIEIEVDEDQTILRAAAEQGVQLMHGCKEGQCAACKSFVLEGEDIELDRYSTFALPDYEKEEGSTLLCRAHAYEDLVIELLNYDEEIIRSGLPLRKGVVEVVANEPVTHDMRHLVVKLVEPEEIKFFPGQYMDFTVPEHRGEPVVLDGQHARPRGPLRVRHQGLPGRAVLRVPGRRRWRSATASRWRRRSAPSPCARAGPRTWSSSAAAPAWRRCWGCCGRWPSAASSARRVFYYGARQQRDLCFEKELRALEETAARLPVRPGPLRAGRRRRMGRRGRADHRGRPEARAGPEGQGRLCVRTAADGGRGDHDAHGTRSARGEHLLRQVHHHR